MIQFFCIIIHNISIKWICKTIAKYEKQFCSSFRSNIPEKWHRKYNQLSERLIKVTWIDDKGNLFRISGQHLYGRWWYNIVFIMQRRRMYLCWIHTWMRCSLYCILYCTVRIRSSNTVYLWWINSKQRRIMYIGSSSSLSRWSLIITIDVQLRH